METSAFKNPHVRKLRLSPPLEPNELPPHPLLSSLQTQTYLPGDLIAFTNEVLREAIAFTDGVVPTTFKNNGSPKSSLPSVAKVQLLSSDLIKGEMWFARQSYHEDRAGDGTATYHEFEAGLFRNHSPHEKEYTPTVIDAYKVLDWGEVKEQEGTEDARKLMVGREFEEVEMEIYEMVHHIPEPLQDRIFPVLVVRAKTSPNSFVIAQFPVDITRLPQAMYSNGRHRTEGDSAEKRGKMTIGAYTSVERVKVLDDGRIHWEMATASDAKGMLPMAIQKMGVPGAVVKDVGLFMKWVAGKR